MHNNLDTVEEFWSWSQIERAFQDSTTESQAQFCSDFASFLGVDSDSVRLMPSGHQGLEWLFRARSDRRRIVMLPAFNCSVVQDAARGAGYEVKLYDFSSNPGIFNWEHLIESLTPSIGVLIVTHYFGVPIDFSAILEHCAQNGITIIEDCAHTLGGSVNGKPVGTIGDAAIFSFNYDKPISLGWGGLVVVNDPAKFEMSFSLDYQQPTAKEEKELLQTFFDAMSQRRKMIPQQNSLALRMLTRARLIKTKNFQKSREITVGVTQAELGRWCLNEYSKVVHIRNANAQRLADAIPQPTWPLGGSVTPAWVKQKVCIEDPGALKYLSRRLQSRGLRVGNFNWPELLTTENSSRFPFAREAATNWIDVPVHQNLMPEHLDEIITAFREVA